MKTKKRAARVKRAERDLAAAAGGAAAGAMVGAVAGPVGAVVGAIAGGAAGALATEGVAASEAAKNRNDRRLDKEIGVSEGELGAPNLKHPPAKVGAYSAAAAGAPSHSAEVAEGPMQNPDE